MTILQIVGAMLLVVTVSLLLYLAYVDRQETKRLEDLARVIGMLNPDAPDYDEWKARRDEEIRR